MLYAGVLAAGAIGGGHVALFGGHVPFGTESYAVLVAAGTLGSLAGALVGYGVGAFSRRAVLDQTACVPRRSSPRSRSWPQRRSTRRRSRPRKRVAAEAAGGDGDRRAALERGEAAEQRSRVHQERTQALVAEHETEGRVHAQLAEAASEQARMLEQQYDG